MHEVVWSRQLVPLIGAEAYAQAVALAVFMAGLAAGALLARRRADRGRPLRDYALLELAIAGYALAIPLLLAAAGAGYLALARLLFPHDAARLAIRFALTILIVAPPAILMGATLPLLAGALARQAPGQLRRRVSALYAANCAGAVSGTALAGFVALPLLGTWGALAIAALANLAAAALVAPFARREPASASLGGAPPTSAPVIPDGRATARPLRFRPGGALHRALRQRAVCHGVRGAVRAGGGPGDGLVGLRLLRHVDRVHRGDRARQRAAGAAGDPLVAGRAGDHPARRASSRSWPRRRCWPGCPT